MCVQRNNVTSQPSQPRMAYSTMHVKCAWCCMKTGCRLVPETIPTAQNCAILAVALSQTPLESTHFLLFLGPLNFLIHKFTNLNWCTYADTDSHLLFQKRSKSVQNKWLKSVLYWSQIIKRFGIFRCNPLGYSHKFFV